MIVPQPPILLGTGEDLPLSARSARQACGLRRNGFAAGGGPLPPLRGRHPVPGGGSLAQATDVPIADRVVHPFWEISKDGTASVPVRPDAPHQEDAGRKRAKDSSKTKLPFSRDPKGSAGTRLPFGSRLNGLMCGSAEQKRREPPGGRAARGDRVVELGMAGGRREEAGLAPGPAWFGKTLGREDGEASTTLPNLLADGDSGEPLGERFASRPGVPTAASAFWVGS